MFANTLGRLRLRPPSGNVLALLDLDHALLKLAMRAQRLRPSVIMVFAANAAYEGTSRAYATIPSQNVMLCPTLQTLPSRQTTHQARLLSPRPPTTSVTHLSLSLSPRLTLLRRWRWHARLALPKSMLPHRYTKVSIFAHGLF